MNDHYFIISYSPEGYYFDEFFNFHQAAQECIELTDLNDTNSKFSGCDIIKGTVLYNNNN